MRKISLKEMLTILFQDAEEHAIDTHKFLVSCDVGYSYISYIDLEYNTIGLKNDEIVPIYELCERDIYIEQNNKNI